MEHKSVFLLTSVSLIYCLCVSNAQLQLTTLPAQPKDIVISSRSSVFVGINIDGNGRIYRFNGTLAQQEVLQFSYGTTVLALVLSPDESRLIVCLSNNSCTDYDANYLNKGSVSTFQNILAANNLFGYVSLVSAPVSGGGNSFYVGSSNGTLNLLGQYGLDGISENVSRSSGNLFIVTASSFTRNWFGGFVAGSYTYFVVFDVSPISHTGVRVLRLCNNGNDTSVAAMSEIELDCFTSNYLDINARFAGASLVNYPINAASGLFEARIVIGIVTPPFIGNFGSYRSRVCTYSLSQIDFMMDYAYAQCSPGSLPWLNAVASLTCSAPCSISPPGAIEAATLSQSSFPVPVPSVNTSFELSYSLSINIEGLTLLFIASTSQLNQLGNSTLQAFNVIDGSAYIPGTWFSTWPMPGPVTKLTWTSGQNYVYAITTNSVVYVPIEQCSSFTDCLRCASTLSPLCGWCTVEQKCSRRSQCQNSTFSARWVQVSTSQCISNSSVTPTTFILELPSNITLTVSSRFPPLLFGESFLCLLNTGNGVLTSVPCLQVNQTTIIANIINNIELVQNVPKLVVNIGVGSSFLNTPFVTNTLTTYNCAAATSCSSCLQTDGVCVWCNVEKRCTAVASSCNNSISVNPAGGQTYLDVCPFVLNGIYTLPITVNRPLVLNTKTLSPQISGYMYICCIKLPNGAYCLPTNYTSSTSINCLYTAAQISLPVGTTIMVANLSLIWTNNGAIMYPIDSLGVIQVTLYSCSAFSVTACTSCLAMNIGTGYDCGWCSGTSSCVEPETCISPLTFVKQSNQCPPPVLTSVSPSSGPFGGGTRLTITGTNLGVTVRDIVNVTVGGEPCIIQVAGYIAGKQIICVTGAYTPGGMQIISASVIVTINRSGLLATVQSNFEYAYVKPSISSILPKSGPMSGGTNIMIGGMFLNVGNGVKRVLVNESVCAILWSSLTQITCISSAQNVTGVSMVTVYIDNEVTINNTITFKYMNNPNYISVSPVRTIPAGGIILTFTGTYLDVTQKALLILNGMTSPCNQTFTSLKCYALPLVQYLSGSRLTPGVNYTIVMDGAPGPVGDTLTITVVPNPNFTSINFADRIQINGSVKSITIVGINILNVDLPEIMVSVDGEPCAINPNLVTSSALSCTPPDLTNIELSSSISYNTKVQVTIGINLVYEVGNITYILTASTPGMSHTLTPMPGTINLVASVSQTLTSMSATINLVASVSQTLTSMSGTINLVASVSQTLTPTPTIVNRAQIVPPFPLTSVAGGVAGGGIGFILILVLVVIIIVMCKKNSAKSYQINVLMSQLGSVEVKKNMNATTSEDSAAI